MTLETLFNGIKIVEVRISYTVLKHGAKIHTIYNNDMPGVLFWR